MENYEYFIFSSHEGYINQNLSRCLEDGWEIAGDAHVKYHDSPTSAAFIYIPLKRIKNDKVIPQRITIVSEISQIMPNSEQEVQECDARKAK